MLTKLTLPLVDLGLDATRARWIAALPALVRCASIARRLDPDERLGVLGSAPPALEHEATLPERVGSDITTLRVRCEDRPCEGHCDLFSFRGSATRTLQLTVLSCDGPGGQVLVSISTQADGDGPCRPASIELDLNIPDLELLVRERLTAPGPGPRPSSRP